jgi:glycosyltransferase involved in cell wall biosynthesis
MSASSRGGARAPGPVLRAGAVAAPGYLLPARSGASAPSPGRVGLGGPAPAPAGRDRPVTVLHVVSTLLPGGTELAMLRLIGSMDPARWRFRVAWLCGDPVLGARVEATTGAAPIPIELRAKADPRALLRLIRIIRATGADLVHTHMDLADYYGAGAARLLGRALVCTKENADEFRTRRTWKRPPFLVLEHLAYAAADAVIVVSHALVDFLEREEGLPRHKTIVIENGVDPDLAARAPGREEARRILGVPDGAPLLGTVGRLAEQKGQAWLIRALPEIRAAAPGARLLVAGDGPLRSAREAEAARAGVSQAVRFLGHRDDVATILAAVDLFVLPSLWEGLPVALLEAMAMARPVVAARAVGIEETVGDGVEGLLVPPRDAAALAEACLRVLREPEFGRRLGAAGRRRVLERHDLDAVAARVAGVYDTALAGRR